MARGLPNYPNTLLALLEGVIDQNCWRLLSFVIIFSILKVFESPQWMQHRTERMSCHPDLPSGGSWIYLLQIFQGQLGCYRPESVSFSVARLEQAAPAWLQCCHWKWHESVSPSHPNLIPDYCLDKLIILWKDLINIFR